ncbi:hypothetical protein GCM10023189_33210 [Nibrella saemangeumensis]|uniref:FAS1 domain-containing protein n=1 Tax=Nibrella saemangeumensis TaxID=1084526 RepID=A0ABP8N131_9BACT
MINRLFFQVTTGLWLATLIAGSLALTSCENTTDDDANISPQYQTAADWFDASTNTTAGNYSLFSASLSRAGLTDSIRRNNITLFVPSDAAFRRAGYADVNAINAAPIATLQQVLRYHMLRTNVPPSVFETSGTATVTTAGNAMAYINRNTATNRVYINNAQLLETQLLSNGGTLYLIDRLLMPPAGNLLQVAQTNPNLSLLVAAVRRGGAAVLNALSTSANPLTVFAPTNAAFQAAGYADTTAINRADAATLQNILTYHVVNGRVFSPFYTTGRVTTLQGGTAAVTVSGNAVTILGSGNGTSAANVTQPDMMATNGVIHVIDRVLLP